MWQRTRFDPFWHDAMRSAQVRRILWHLSDFLDYGAAFHMLRGELIVEELPGPALLVRRPHLV